MKSFVVIIALLWHASAWSLCSDMTTGSEISKCIKTTYNISISPWTASSLSTQEILAGYKNVAKAFEQNPQLQDKQFRIIWLSRSNQATPSDINSSQPEASVAYNSDPKAIFGFLDKQQTNLQRVARFETLQKQIEDLSKDISERAGVSEVRCLRDLRNQEDCLRTLNVILGQVKSLGQHLNANRILIGTKFESGTDDHKRSPLRTGDFEIDGRATKDMIIKFIGKIPTGGPDEMSPASRHNATPVQPTGGSR